MFQIERYENGKWSATSRPFPDLDQAKKFARLRKAIKQTVRIRNTETDEIVWSS